MKFYKNKWFWGLVLFVVLSVTWNVYGSFAENINNYVEPKVSDHQFIQDVQSDMLPDTRLSINDISHGNPSSEQNESITEKLSKVKDSKELQKKKTFMLAVAQDDLEHYIWCEESQSPDIWRQLILKYNLDGSQIMIALQDDLNLYLDHGKSDYDLVWTMADVTYEAYKSGKLKTIMTTQAYQGFINNLNEVSSRLGILYAKREYILRYQLQQAPY